ncbi:hypothetical protein ACOBR2_06430 [Telmatobacter bradus]|uniref:hypothetical protein n=1 Tax=Telmatobacter bradus TaxID=474953 RepID=UPI003B43BBAD
MRDLSIEMVAALIADVVYPSVLVDLCFEDNTLHVWNGSGNVVWNGNTYLGVGDFGTIGAMTETIATEAKGTTLSLSGIDSTLLAECMGEITAFNTCNVYLCFWDGPNHTSIISQPFLSLTGYLDSPVIEDDGKTSTIQVSVENPLLDMNRICVRRYTADDNRIDIAARLTALGLSTSTTDTFFSFVNAIQLAQVWWGTNPASTND